MWSVKYLLFSFINEVKKFLESIKSNNERNVYTIFKGRVTDFLYIKILQHFNFWICHQNSVFVRNTLRNFLYIEYRYYYCKSKLYKLTIQPPFIIHSFSLSSSFVSSVLIVFNHLLKIFFKFYLRLRWLNTSSLSRRKRESEIGNY